MQYKTIGIGEILWDILPDGKLLGGAPANFAYHTQQLGAQASVISAVGNDSLGHEINKTIAQKELNNCIVQIEKPTGTVSVDLHEGIPDYTIHQDVAWDYLKIDERAKQALIKADAICFGSLAQRSLTSRQTIQDALKLARNKALLVFDINLRQHFFSKEIVEESLTIANVVKMNKEELDTLSELLNLKGTLQEKANTILGQFDLQMLAITLGEGGSYLISRGAVSFLKTPKVNVVDTIGAGDSFTAAMTMGLLKKKPIGKIHQEAVELSAFVCTKHGAMPNFQYFE